jgi:hypothetical protein
MTLLHRISIFPTEQELLRINVLGRNANAINITAEHFLTGCQTTRLLSKYACNYEKVVLALYINISQLYWIMDTEYQFRYNISRTQ